MYSFYLFNYLFKEKQQCINYKNKQKTIYIFWGAVCSNCVLLKWMVWCGTDPTWSSTQTRSSTCPKTALAVFTSVTISTPRRSLCAKRYFTTAVAFICRHYMHPSFLSADIYTIHGMSGCCFFAELYIVFSFLFLFAPQ